MLDHIGISVTDTTRSKAFYDAALAPIGIALVLEVPPEVTQTGGAACGYGKDHKPFFWFGQGKASEGVHIAVNLMIRYLEWSCGASGERNRGGPLRPDCQDHSGRSGVGDDLPGDPVGLREDRIVRAAAWRCWVDRSIGDIEPRIVEHLAFVIDHAAAGVLSHGGATALMNRSPAASRVALFDSGHLPSTLLLTQGFEECVKLHGDAPL